MIWPFNRKTQPSIGADRAARHLQSRFSPIRGLEPEKLARLLDQFARGELRECAMLWDAIRRRDDQVITVSTKRAQAPAMLDYEIIAVDDSPEAQLHKQALEYAYDNLTATHAIERDQRGGIDLLIEQMMDAVGMSASVHELLWEQDAQGRMTFTAVHVPLWFFERRAGRLRFLETEGSYEGVDLEPGGWLVTTGPGLMEATSVSYIFKNLPLKDWLNYSEKFAMPGLHGKTTAAKDSPEWTAFRDAIAAFGQDWALVTSLDAKIEKIEGGSQGTQPHPALVDRMDRAIARIWRGGDLSTMSAGGEAVGANPQSDEAEAMLLRDANRVSSALQQRVDEWVIRCRFGPGVRPLAYFRLIPPAHEDLTRELSIDDKLISWGVPRSIADLREKYGRPEPTPGEPLARISQPTTPAFPSPFAPSAFANAQATGQTAVERAQALDRLSAAQRQAFAPLIARIDELEAAPDAEFPAKLERLQRDLPKLYKEVAADPALATTFEAILGAELARSAVQTLQAKKPAHE